MSKLTKWALIHRKVWCLVRWSLALLMYQCIRIVCLHLHDLHFLHNSFLPLKRVMNIFAWLYLINSILVWVNCVFSSSHWNSWTVKYCQNLKRIGRRFHISTSKYCCWLLSKAHQWVFDVDQYSWVMAHTEIYKSVYSNNMINFND